MKKCLAILLWICSMSAFAHTGSCLFQVEGTSSQYCAQVDSDQIEVLEAFKSNCHPGVWTNSACKENPGATCVSSLPVGTVTTVFYHFSNGDLETNHLNCINNGGIWK